MTRYEKFAELAYRVACGMRCNHGVKTPSGNPCFKCPYDSDRENCGDALEKDVGKLGELLSDFKKNVREAEYGCEEVENDDY